ncbi:MAG: hypothetical protein WCL16_12585 [bacterium]
MNFTHAMLGGWRGAVLLVPRLASGVIRVHPRPCVVRFAAIAVLGMLAGTGWGAAGDFERYMVILERKPFGAEAPVVAAGTAPAAVPDAESFIKTLKMTAITKNDLTESVCVGLSDTTTKKNYFLTVGDEEDGIALVEADYDHDRALLRKAGDSRWINMNGDVAAGAAAPSLRGLPPPPSLASVRSVVRGSSSGPPGLTTEQYQRTRHLRPMPSPPSSSLGRGDASPGGVKLSNEEIEAKLRKYNMDLIRAGGEKGIPLPIELSPEEDAQLVKEGVLE